MVLETWVQSQVASYQRLLIWYLIPPWLTLSKISYVSRVKWSNPGKGVALSPTRWCSSYWKGSLLVTLDNSRQHYLHHREKSYPEEEKNWCKFIIIMSRHQCISSWPSPATFLYHPSLPVSLQGYILYRYVGSSWSSCLCSSMWRGPQEYVTYEFVSTSPVLSRMSGSSNLDSFRDEW